MPRPGVDVLNINTPVSRGAPTDNSAFVVGVVSSGPVGEVSVIAGIGDFEVLYGERDATNATLYDWVNVSYREGPAKKTYIIGLADPADPEDFTDAFDLFPADLGPGRMYCPGVNTGANLALLADAAKATDRVAHGDLLDATVSEAVAIAATVRAADGADVIALWYGQVEVPGPAGTTLTVPYTAAQEGVEARRDSAGNPNAVAAFVDYPFRYVRALTQATLSDADRTLLTDAGVNAGKDYFGSLVSWGYRSAADQTTAPVYWQFDHANLRAAVTSQAKKIAGTFVGRQIDANGHTAARLKNALEGMLKGYYDEDALYGDLGDDNNLPFIVDVGPAVNTATSIAAGSLKAVLAIRMSDFAELVEISINTVASNVAL